MHKEETSRKVVIVTVGTKLLFSNYGSFLQHYALREVLKSFGLEPVRLRGAGEKGGRLEWLYAFFRNRVYVPLMLLRTRGLSACFEYIVRLPKLCVERKFRKEYHRHIGPVLEDAGTQMPAIALVGSDQVWWDPDRRAMLDVFDAHCRRISYAASADWRRASGDLNWKDTMRRILPGFNYISVREEAGVELLKQVVPGCAVTKVVDPVLLAGRASLDNLIAKKMILRQPTLLVYYVNVLEKADLPFELLHELSKELGVDLKIVDMQCVSRFVPHKYILRPSPSQFLRAICDAEYVVTNSFHGTALSLLYHKRFVSIGQKITSTANQNCRQAELLESVGLQERLLPTESKLDQIRRVLSPQYDKCKIDDILDAQRIHSKKWLFQAAGAK